MLVCLVPRIRDLYAKRAHPLSGCRVLIVEDEYFLAADLQAALKSLGANVIALVGDLDEALVLLANGGFDIAVVDINLRGSWPLVLLSDCNSEGFRSCS